MSITNVFNEQGGTVPSTGGGGGDSGGWISVQASDISTEKQDMNAFTLSPSLRSGFDHQISIQRNTTGVFNEFRRNEVGVLIFDTGFTMAELGDGELSTAVFQVLWEPYNIESGSTYTTDIAFPLGVCLFSSLSSPPFNTGLKGGFYGHGLLHTKSGSTLIANDTFVRRLRNQSTAGIRGTSFTYGANERVQSLLHTLTVSKTETGGNKSMMLTQGDFNMFIRDTTTNKDQVSITIGQQTDLGQTDVSTDTIKFGVMFNLFIDAANGGSSPSPTKTWDFNLKYRKMVAT